MKTRDDVLLEQAYQRVLLREDQYKGYPEAVKDGILGIPDVTGRLVKIFDHEGRGYVTSNVNNPNFHGVELVSGQSYRIKGIDDQHAVSYAEINPYGDEDSSEESLVGILIPVQDAGQGPTQDDMYYTKLK